MTLFAAPCSHTNTTAGSRDAVAGACTGATIATANTNSSIIVGPPRRLGAPTLTRVCRPADQKRNVYWSLDDVRSNVDANVSSNVFTQPRLTTTNRSLPGFRIHRKRLWKLRICDWLSNCSRFCHDTLAVKL